MQGSALCIRYQAAGTKGKASLQRRQHAGENLEVKIFFVAQAVGASLKNTDFVVEAFDEAKRDFVFRLAVGGDAVPVLKTTHSIS